MNSTVLVLGATGSFGRAYTNTTLTTRSVQTIRAFSRDESKQAEMQREYSHDPRLRFFIGDIRDRDRLRRAMEGADVVVHAAAMKHVPACEYNPAEAIKTNVVGAMNVIDCALDAGVQKVLAISTDKAVNPVNLYGATKMCQEKLVVQANSYSGGRTKFACVRYGNVVGSRGSVVELFEKQKATGILTITDSRMTRFWITLKDAISFVETSIEIMRGGEVFVPKLKSRRVIDIAYEICPNAAIKEIGIRPGEKLHEVLITKEEALHTIDLGDRYCIEPEFQWWGKRAHEGQKLPLDFTYTSELQPQRAVICGY